MNHGSSAQATQADSAKPAPSPAGAMLAFAPFAAFVLVEKLLGPLAGLAAGALVSIALLLRERLLGVREVNILEAGSALMFSGLTVLAWTGDAAGWTLWTVRLWVDSGLLLLVLFSIAIRRPFTLQHARRQVSAEIAARPAFLRANTLLSGVWALAFAVLVAMDALMVLRPQTPASIAVVLTVAALLAAFKFTTSFAARRQAAARGATEAGHGA